MPDDMAPTIGWNKTATKKDKQSMQNAQRNNQVEAQEKHGANAPNHSIGPSNAKKLDEDTGVYKHSAVTPEFKKALMQARMAKKMNQKDLAQQCNLAPAIIQSYENGSAVPEGPIIAKLNRVLGVALPKIPKPPKKKD